jgi:hypothetical protein
VWLDTVFTTEITHESEPAAQARLRAQVAELTTALHQVNFAAEKLREAFDEQDIAMRAMRRAQRAQQRAFKRVLEADHARQEAMAPFTVEDWHTD